MEKLSILFIPLFLSVGIAQLVFGYAGIEYHFGHIAAFFGLFAAFGFRFLLPMTIGSYFGAVDVFGWPWWGGLLIALPGLVFLVPAILAAVIDLIKPNR